MHITSLIRGYRVGLWEKNVEFLNEYGTFVYKFTVKTLNKKCVYPGLLKISRIGNFKLVLIAIHRDPIHHNISCCIYEWNT